VRRLYSSFARGAPGAGLLLLRVAAGAVLLADAAAFFRAGTPATFVALGVVSSGSGLLLLLGLWTPVAAAMAAAIALWHVVTTWPDPGLHALSALLGVALALLGPGGWSVDARLFGWKRFEIRNDDSNDHARRQERDESTPR
jgi:uncharacterized membrane protein YphA (DoxX/SURF4 family)